MTIPATTSQTVGPYFQIGFGPLYRNELIQGAMPGKRVTIQGRVLDGEGKPVPDAVLEIWQADPQGNYATREEAGKSERQAEFSGFGRIPTNGEGKFRFTTIRPGSVSGPAGELQAPHIVVSIFMRGLLTRLVTRIYFEGDARNENDTIMKLVADNRRDTLLARPVAGGESVLEWNVFLQGKNETVFFDF